MSVEAIRRSDFAELARDPLVRLVMDSDGVTEAEFVAVLQTARRAMDARTATGRYCDAAARRTGRRIRAVPAAGCHGVWV
jgi:hypothetical protein